MDEGRKPRTVAQIASDLEKATTRYVAAQAASNAAHENHRIAGLDLNRLQSEYDRAVDRIREGAPEGSNWWRATHPEVKES